MRLAIALSALALLSACQVTKDDGNNSVSMTYNSDVAENTAADVGNAAQNIAGDISNDVKRTGDKIENRVGDKNVTVSVESNASTNKQ